MKFAATCLSLMLFATLTATLAFAQTYTTQIKNVIVVIQENRTPDNLFQDQNLINAGADISQSGLCGTTMNHDQQTLGARTLQDCADPDHSHQPSWLNSYDGNLMDGACTVSVTYSGKCEKFTCPQGNSKGETDCTQYAYVSDTDGLIKPYWQIAENYGFANYFFQTNQGPSFPAHQFIFSGTSAPTTETSGTPTYLDFAAENTTGCQGQGCKNSEDAGCIATSGVTAALVDTSGVESTQMYPCYSHPTLADLLDAGGVPWRYYSGVDAGIWTAPNAITAICGSTGYGGNCNGTEWNNHVKNYLEGSTRNGQTTLAPFLYDLKNCQLETSGGVYFVVPDGRWSDHAGDNWGLGPDWVANIVNLVGRTTAQGGCSDPQPNWNNTAILVVWDDWGGWYDHVLPYNYNGNNGKGGYTNDTGSSYVYGFRVPFLVVSAYVKETNGNPGYISGTKQNPIYYDFGSILKFIEETYGITNEINSLYHYADFFAGQRNKGDLSDFFSFSTGARTFISITLADNPTYCNNNPGDNGECGQTSCNVACFINYPGGARDPDDQ
jgi:phospholipase C